MEYRNYKIKRTCTKHYTNYHSYKKHLAEDFQHRCAYCNLLDTEVTSHFEIDHFVPQAEIKKHPSCSHLVNDYKNLVYSCGNCNREKSDIFEGNLETNPYENNRFYDPEKVDYNTIFFRNKCGSICSNDSKGKSMIVDLKLYRPIHNIAWICEQLDILSEKLQVLGDNETDPERKSLIEQAKQETLRYYKSCKKIHTANFNNKNFSINDIAI